MRAIDLIRAEQYRLQQVENSGDSTGAWGDDALQVATAISLLGGGSIPDPADEDEWPGMEELIAAGARIAQAIDILRETE
jgi:hypothetical protein